MNKQLYPILLLALGLYADSTAAHPLSKRTYKSCRDSLPADKRKFTLFHPVPKNQMREMETDRPDDTENPHTLDAGHFQYETDIFRSIRNKTGNQSAVTAIYNNFNLKLGLAHSTDLQLGLESYITEKIKDRSGAVLRSSSGLGNITVRIKQNIWGNDDSRTALGLIPYVILPVSKIEPDKKTEGGLIIPFALELSDKWDFAAQLQGGLFQNENRNYQLQLGQSAVVGRSLTDAAGSYTEVVYTWNVRTGQADLFLNGGLTYALTADLQFDAGVSIGITKGSDKVYFAGFSFRY